MITITLSTEEFGKFAARQEQWFRDRFEFAMKGVLEMGMDFRAHSFAGDGRSVFRDRLHKLYAQFETEHPKPDWRSLLE